MRLFLFVLLLVNLATSCTKDAAEPPFPIVPNINLEAQSSQQLAAFTDTLYLTIAYQDGDGDLGGLNGKSRIFARDTRLNVPDTFALSELTPDGQPLAITGTLRLALGPYFILSNAESESFQIELWLSDRIGNQSNKIMSDSILLIRN